jgi:hypothetical protein
MHLFVHNSRNIVDNKEKKKLINFKKIVTIMEWNILHNICLEHMLCLVENFSLIFEAQGVLMSKQRWVMISEHQVLFKTFNLKTK